MNNIDALIGGILGVLAFVLICRVLTKQLDEYLQPQDNYTRLKLYLLVLNLIFAGFLIPSTFYLFMRAFGVDVPIFRSIATYAGRLGAIAMAINMNLIYDYKYKK